MDIPEDPPESLLKLMEKPKDIEPKKKVELPEVSPFRKLTKEEILEQVTLPVPDLNKAIDMMPEPEQERAKIDNTLPMASILEMKRSMAYKLHDQIVQEYTGKKESPTTFRERIKNYWKGAVLTQQLGELYSDIIFKGDSEGLRKKIADVEGQMPPVEDIIESLPEKMKRRFKEYYLGEEPYLKRLRSLVGETAEESVKLIIEQVPRWMQAGKEGAVLGPILMGTALGITALVGLAIPAPEELITYPAAAKVGLTLGMKIGAFKSLARTASGLSLRNLEQFEDARGRKMDPTIAKFIAQGIGTIEAASELVELDLLFKTFPIKRTSQQVAKQAIVNTMISKKFKKIVGKGVGKYTAFTAKELSQELFQETVHIIGEELGKELNNAFKGTDIKKAQIKEIVERYKETALASMLMFPVLGLPGTVTTTIQSVAEIAKEKGITEAEAKKVQEAEIKRVEDLEEGLEIPPEKGIRILVGKDREIVNEVDLEVGQKFTVGGKSFKVTEKTDEGAVIRSGKSEITLTNFQSMEIDRDSLSERITPIKKDKIIDVARKLWQEERAEYEELSKTDLVSQIEAMGKINVRYFVESEEISGIPKDIRKRIFTTDPTAQDMDEIASSLGMTDNELIQKLQAYEPMEKPPALKEYVETLTREYGTSLERLLVESEREKSLVSKTRSTLRKAYHIGKKEAVQEAKKKYQEAVIRKRARTEMRKHINDILKDLKNAEAKTAKMYPEFATPITQLLQGIDLVRHNKPYLMELRTIRKYFEDNPEAEISDRTKDKLDILDKRNLNNVTIDELEDIHVAVMHYTHLNKRAQEIRIGDQQMKKDVAIALSISEMKSPKDIENRIVGHYGSAKAKIDKFWMNVKTFFGLGHMHYDLIVELVSGPNSAIDKVFYQNIKEGSNNQLSFRQKTFNKYWDSVKPILDKYKIKNMVKWLNEKVQIGMFEFTRNERMALYRHSLLDDNRRTIIDGGFGLRREKDPNRVFSMSEAQLNEILESLTPAEREFAGEPVSILFDEIIYEAMNKVFIEKNGYTLPKVEQYYRKDVMPAARRTDIDIETETALEKFRGQWMRIGISKGMLKERLDVRTPIYLNGLTYDINSGVMRAAAYVGLEIPLSNASRVLYDKEFKGEFLSRYGKETYKAIEQGMRDIAGEWKSYGFFEEKLVKLRSNLTVAALGLNPFVWIIQPLSHSAYLTYVKPKYLIRGMVEFIAHPKEIAERHKLNSVEFVERTKTGFSRDLAEIMKMHTETNIERWKKNFQELMMKPIQWADLKAVVPGMQGAVLQVLDEFHEGKLSREVKQALDIKDSEIADLDPIEKMKLAYKFADYATERTQPQFAPEHMAPIQRGSPAAKFITMFSATTNQYLNLLYRTWNDLALTKDPAALKKFAWAVLTVGVINPIGMLAREELRDFIYGREDDKDKLWLDLLNIFSGYFFALRDFVSSAVSKIKYGVFAGYDIQIPITRFAMVIVDAVVYGYEMVAATSKKKREKAAMKCLDNTIRALTMRQGIPYDTPKKIIERFVE